MLLDKKDASNQLHVHETTSPPRLIHRTETVHARMHKSNAVLNIIADNLGIFQQLIVSFSQHVAN